MTKPGYLLDNAAADAGQRFESLAAVFDPWTFQHFEALGLGRGWRCWEVGAGGPTVASWLAARSGAEGTVVATDIDTSWVDGDRAYQVLVSDVAADEPPGSDFHLVHARLVLVHVPGRDEALRRMVAALRPGGWLVVEDFDTASGVDACLHVIGPAQERANRIREAFAALLVDRGADPVLGRSLPARLRSLGLVDVRADAYTPVALPAAARLEQANTRQVRAGLVAKGISEEDVDAHLAALAAGELDVATPALITAWGRKP